MGQEQFAAAGNSRPTPAVHAYQPPGIHVKNEN